MFFDCPSVTFWNHLAKIPNQLLGLHILLKKLLLYSYFMLDTTPQERANYLLVLAKTTICKAYLATHSTHCHTPDYHMFCRGLQYQLPNALQPMGKCY
jgi:hypothetical protein